MFGRKLGRFAALALALVVALGGVGLADRASHAPAHADAVAAIASVATLGEWS